MIRAYGVLDGEGRRSLRATFVLDQEGKIRHKNAFYSPSNLGHYRAIFTALGFSEA